MIRCLTAKVEGHKTDNSTMPSLCQITWFSILILTCILTFGTHEAFSQDESQLPDIDDEIIVKVEALNVRVNHEIPEGDPKKNIDFTAKIGDRGIVKNGPMVIPPYTWYEIQWNNDRKGWSVSHTQNGCTMIVTVERAEKKDEIASKLFNMSHTETLHDYNNHGCFSDWGIPGYNGGHSGWDVQTVSVAKLASENEFFYSLTEGIVVKAGADDPEPDAFNTVAVFSSEDGSKENGMTTSYLHARVTCVYLGQKVYVGTRLGIQGNVGVHKDPNDPDLPLYKDKEHSYREHVHIEIRKGCHSRPASGAVATEDPIDYLYNWVVNTEPIEPPRTADINEDGFIDADDAVLIITHLIRNPDQFDPDLDVNRDKIVNVSDALVIVDIMYSYLCELKKEELEANNAPSQLTRFHQRTVQDLLNTIREIDNPSLANKSHISMLEQLLRMRIPRRTILLANYPNPFNPETWIPYQLAQDSHVSIKIYNAAGILIRKFDIGYQKAGDYTSQNLAVHWDGRSDIGEHVASGVYFYTLSSKDYTATRRMAILK